MLRVWVLLGWVVVAGGADAGASCSGSGSNACATPEPTSHLQTILSWDCEGRIRFLPDNPLFNINVDAPMLPRTFQGFLEGVNTYINAHCNSLREDVSWTEFLQRYHPLNAFLYGNKLYKESSNPVKNCLDNAKSFTRDLVKLYEALAGKTSFEMPSSCPYYYWEDNAKCSFVHELMEIGAEVQVSVKRCSTNADFFKLFVGCNGPGCSVFKPCRIDEECNAKDHLICTDPFQWEDPKTGGPPKFTESDAYDLLRDTFKLYSSTKNLTSDPCTDYFPKKLFATFVTRFERYIVDSPQANLGRSSCENGACKICLPTHTTAFEDIFTEFPGRWKEVDEDVYPKPRQKYDKDGCFMSPDRLKGNTSLSLVGEGLPSILEPQQPAGLYPTMTDKFATSPLVMGTKMYIKGSKTYIGGGTCVSDSQCGTATETKGVCITNTEYCQMAALECEDQDLCEWDPALSSCIPTIVAAADTTKKCACFALEKLTSTNASYGFVHGKSCDTVKYIATVEAESMLDSVYATGLHKWRGRYDPFIDWDGYAAADGVDPFRIRDHWALFPVTRAPLDETHLASVQCDGVVHFFQGTPFALRVHSPMLTDILQWWSEVGLDTWTCRDLSNVNQARYLISNALWRPEPWLFAKVADKDFSTHSEPPGFGDTLTQWMFPMVADALQTSTFEIFNYQHIAELSEGFTLSDWFSTLKIGTTYTGLRGAKMDAEWALNFRAASCPSHPQGLVQYDLTCLGRSCGEMLLSSLCTSDTDCVVPSQCLNVFADIYTDDIPKQVLWGTERDSGTQYFTDDSLCPALEGYGTNGMTSRSVGQEPIRDLVEKVWQANRYAGCAKRQEAECWGHCKWEKTRCTDLVPPKSVGTQADLKFCTPYVYPLWDAFVTDMKYTSAVIGEPNTAGLYTLDQRRVHSSSVAAQIFGIRHETADLREASAEATEDVEKPDMSVAQATFGTSFIAVMLAMALIVCIASGCVWYHYIRVTKHEKEKVARLHGLTFAFKQDTDKYGRDLMLPQMESEWLPGKEENSDPRKKGVKKSVSAESLNEKADEEVHQEEEKVHQEQQEVEVEMDEMSMKRKSGASQSGVGESSFSKAPSASQSRQHSASPRPGSDGSLHEGNGSFSPAYPQARSPVYGSPDWGSVNNTSMGRKKPRSQRSSYSPSTSGHRLPSAKQQHIPVDDSLPPGPPPAGSRPSYHHPQSGTQPRSSRNSLTNNPLDFALSEAKGTISRGGPGAVGSAVDRYSKRAH